MFHIKIKYFSIIFTIGILCILVQIYINPQNILGQISNSTVKISTTNNITTVLKNNSLSYILNKKNITISTPNNNSHVEEFNESKIALVKPVFTDAAYDHKFYPFFKKYANVLPNTNVSTDLDLLNSKITNYQQGTVNNVFAMLDLINVLKWTSNKTQVNVISDIDVHKGKIFANNDTDKRSNLYDILVLGHQEYVTQDEYNNLKQFVSNGGTMIVLDGNVFYAEVKYFDKNNTISLVKGHGWTYNGKSAWKSVNERWMNETKKWVGSNYFCFLCIKAFKNNPFHYSSHEEQYLSNPQDIILLNYNPLELQSGIKTNATVATYELKYGKGLTIGLGIYSDDIIRNGQFDRFFDSLIVKYGLHNDTTTK